MWIEKTRNGLRMVERYEINGKIKRLSVPLERDTPKARKQAAAALAEKAAIITMPISSMKLSAALEEYVKLKDCKESTRKTNRTDNKVIVAILGDDPLASYSAVSVRRTFALDETIPKKKNRAIKAFKAFARWAYEMEYTHEYIAERLRIVKDNTPEKDPSELYLEPEQLKSLLENLHGMPYYISRFLVLTGCRIGEATALTLEDIGENYIHITKAYSIHTREITTPKTKTSIRDIYIQPELAEFLAEYKKWRALDCMAYGKRPKTLFYSRTGELYAENHLARYLRPLGAHPHILRHTHVALLAEQGMTLEAISRRIGHKGAGTTRAVYYHVTEKQRRKDEAALAAIRIL